MALTEYVLFCWCVCLVVFVCLSCQSRVAASTSLEIRWGTADGSQTATITLRGCDIIVDGGGVDERERCFFIT